MKSTKKNIFIIGGPEFSGKSSVTNLIKQMIPYNKKVSNSYKSIKLYKSNDIKKELVNVSEKYCDLLKYLYENPSDENYIFDGIILPEKVFVEMNTMYSSYYNFDKILSLLIKLTERYNVTLVFSYILHIKLYEERALASGFANHDHTKSFIEQSEYLEFINFFSSNYPQIKLLFINTDNDNEKSSIKNQLKKKLTF